MELFNPEMKEEYKVFIFPKGISPKVDVIVQMEFKLALSTISLTSNLATTSLELIHRKIWFHVFLLNSKESKGSKVGDRRRGWLKGSLFDSYYTKV